MTNHTFDVIILGGSYAGLSAAMALGRSLRNVLVIDGGKPCNRQTPHSHNFITQDGNTPKQISTLAKAQVEKYDTVKFHTGFAKNGRKYLDGFEIETLEGDRFMAKKLIFATGIKDIIPDMKGFAACWGISIIHCPYCHGYEVSNEKTGIMGKGDAGFHYAKLISNWTKDLSLFTNGPSTLTVEQLAKLEKNNIPVIETEIAEIQHHLGNIENVVLKDHTKHSVKALYTGPPFVQHSDIPKELGCEMTEHGLIKVDSSQKTSIEGAFACGDNCSMRAISYAVASGTMAGGAANFELIEESF